MRSSLPRRGERLACRQRAARPRRGGRASFSEGVPLDAGVRSWNRSSGTPKADVRLSATASDHSAAAPRANDSNSGTLAHILVERDAPDRFLLMSRSPAGSRSRPTRHRNGRRCSRPRLSTPRRTPACRRRDRSACGRSTRDLRVAWRPRPCPRPAFPGDHAESSPSLNSTIRFPDACRKSNALNSAHALLQRHSRAASPGRGSG